MQRYRVRENLDEYEDELEDRYEDDDEYEDEEVEEEEEEAQEQPRSEEEIRYLQLREKLKAKHRSNLRRENGKNGVNVDPRKLIKFDFFGPSEPTIAKRVIQERKSLLETSHLTPKASTSQNDVKKASLSSTMSKSGPSDRPRPSQVKSKAQIIKQTRDYSWLMSEDAEIPKPEKDPGPRKSLSSKLVSENGRSGQVQAKRHELSSHSAKKGYDVSEQRKPSSKNSQARDDRRAPPQRSASNDSRRQLELRKQNLPNKQVGNNSGSGSRSSVPNVLPPKKPLPSSDRKMAVGSVERKSMGIPVKNRAPGIVKTSTSDPRRQPILKSQASAAVNNRMEHRRDVERSSENKMFRKERVVAPKSQLVNRPNQNVRQSNLDNGHHVKKQKPVAQLQRSSAPLSRDHKSKKRKLPDSESDVDVSKMIRSMFGYDPRRYRDEDDDDMCMEVGFQDIDREEKRSAKIAKQEDDEEYVKILEEEKREKEAILRRKAKKAKMNR